MAIKIQPQTFKSSYIKLIALLSSLISSLLVSIFLLRRVTHTASLAVFIIFGVAYLIAAIVYIVIRNVRKDCKCLKLVWFVDIAYLFGGISYYVGRNLLVLDNICSSSLCDLEVRVSQPIILGMSLVFHRFIPFFISKYYQSSLAKEHQTTEAKLQLVPEWILAAESLTLLVEFDALFAIVVNSFVSDETGCYRLQGPQFVGPWVLWGLLVFTYMFILYYKMNIQYCGSFRANISCVASNFGAILILAAFCLYLLSSNAYPLRCSIHEGDVFESWIPMKVLVLIVVITVIVLLLVYRCLSKTRQEKLLPRTLYQHLHPKPDEQDELQLESINNDEKKEFT